MENILITNVLSELKEENQRLVEENEVIFDLLEKYRNFSFIFHNFTEKSSLKSHIFCPRNDFL